MVQLKRMSKYTPPLSLGLKIDWMSINSAVQYIWHKAALTQWQQNEQEKQSWLFCSQECVVFAPENISKYLVFYIDIGLHLGFFGN